MAENLITIKYDVENIKTKYDNAIKDENVYEAVLMYNRLREYNIPEMNLKQAALYSILNAHTLETNFLLKCVDNEKFFSYNPQSVLMRLSVYFYVYGMIDTFDYYKELLLLKHPYDEQLQGTLNPNSRDATKSLHFVEDEGKLLYAEAMNCMGECDPDNALKILNKIEKTDPMYNKAQNFMSLIYLSVGELNKGKEVLLDLIENNACDIEIVNNIYRFSNFTNAEHEKLINSLENLKNGDNDYEVTMVKSTLLMEEKKYQQTLEELLSIKGYMRYTESYLKQLALCYLRLNNKEQLMQTLKELYTIYPLNFGARCMLMLLEQGDDNLNSRWIFNAFDPQMLKSMRKLVLSEIRDTKSFNNLSLEQAEFVFRVVQETKDYNLIKNTSKLIYKSNYQYLIQDALMAVETKNECRQLMFQVLVEQLSLKEWTFLIDGRIESFKLRIPNLFLQTEINDREKMDYLLTVYAQTYSLFYYAGFDVWEIDEQVGDLFELLFKLPIDVDYPILVDAHYLIYMLVKFISPQENLFEYSFKDIPESIKSEIGEILDKLKKELNN